MNGTFFEKTSLSDLGHCVYIGHHQTRCPSSNLKTQAILVIDINGVHHVNVQFCTCTEDTQWVEKYRQLLRIGWYPASFQRPKTAFTFNVLDTYHKLAIQGKLNLYDFYLFILQKTDNCGRTKAVVSHVFSHIGILLMLFGPSVDITKCRDVSANGDIWNRSSGVVAATQKWALIQSQMVHLPSNAWPVRIQVAIFLKTGIRLPRIPSMSDRPRYPRLKWSKSFLRWLYSCFLAIDANFRLKLKSCGIKDPEIGSRWSYFMENKQYSRHISQKTIEMEVSPFRLLSWPICSRVLRLLAVVQISTPSTRPTASPRRTTLPLALLPACVHDTASCKRMGLEICSEENGAYRWTPLNIYEY